MDQQMEGTSLPKVRHQNLSSLNKYLPILLLLLFCAVIFLSTSFQPAVGDDADGIHAVAAREILQRNDWVTLYVNGVRYLQKAPLLYWLVAISYQIFGFNAFAMRLPTMLAVVALVGVIYLFGHWAYSEKAGLYAGAVMGFSVGVFLFTRIMIPEALLTLLLTVAHLCFLWAFYGTGKQKRLYYGFYVAAALALLTKGLIGIIFAVVPAFLFLLLTGNLSEWKQLRLFSGIALFLAIAAPWHLLAGRNENFFWFYFVNEHFLRFLGQRYPKDYNKIPFLYYWLLHLVWLFPWSLGLPLLIKQLPSFARIRRKNTVPTSPSLVQINLYLWLWAGTILIFFSVSTGMEYYTFPAYPALALLLGAAFASAEVDPSAQRHLLWINGVLAAIGVAVAVVLGLLVGNAFYSQVKGEFSTLLNQNVAEAEKYTFSLGRALDLTPQAFAVLAYPAIATAIVLSLGFLLAFWFRRQRHHTRAIVAMLLTMGLFFVCANRAYIQFEPVLSSRFMADAIMQRWEPNAKIVITDSFELGSSIAFYTNQQVLLLNGRTLSMDFGSRYPDAPPIFLDYQALQHLWRGANRVFLFTETLKKEALLKKLGLPTYLVVEKGGKSLLVNKP